MVNEPAARDDKRDWHPTGERRWRIIKRGDGYRTLVSERETVDGNSGETRWVPAPHGLHLRTQPAGWTRFPKYERTEPDDGYEGDVLAWDYLQRRRNG
jgi:hypothetical protein